MRVGGEIIKNFLLEKILYITLFVMLVGFVKLKDLKHTAADLY